MNLNQRQNHEKQTQNPGTKNQDLDSIAVKLEVNRRMIMIFSIRKNAEHRPV